jgi:predicted nucleotidyltransferase
VPTSWPATRLRPCEREGPDDAPGRDSVGAESMDGVASIVESSQIGFAMIPALSAHRADIAVLCDRSHVRLLDVFGSAEREDDFTTASDIDFLVEFEPSYGTPALGEFPGLREALASLIGRDVDLTITSAVRNPYLRTAIERSRAPCMERDLAPSTLDRHSREGGNDELKVQRRQPRPVELRTGL